MDRTVCARTNVRKYQPQNYFLLRQAVFQKQEKRDIRRLVLSHPLKGSTI